MRIGVQDHRGVWHDREYEVVAPDHGAALEAGRDTARAENRFARAVRTYGAALSAR